MQHFEEGEVPVRRLTLVVFLILAVAIPAVAQQQYGSISGTALDKDKLALPGVTVTLAGPNMQGTRMAVTDLNGRFRFTPVPPGAGYTLKFELSGFATVETAGVSVGLSKDSQLTAEMASSQ